MKAEKDSSFILCMSSHHDDEDERVEKQRNKKKLYVNEMKGERLSYFFITSCLCRCKVRKYHFIIYTTFQVYKTARREVSGGRKDWNKGRKGKVYI